MKNTLEVFKNSILAIKHPSIQKQARTTRHIRTEGKITGMDTEETSPITPAKFYTIISLERLLKELKSEKRD